MALSGAVLTANNAQEKFQILKPEPEKIALGGLFFMRLHVLRMFDPGSRLFAIKNRYT